MKNEILKFVGMALLMLCMCCVKAEHWWAIALMLIVGIQMIRIGLEDEGSAENAKKTD